MKSLIISAFLFIIAYCFAGPTCGTITAQYIGPTGGGLCQDTNCITLGSLPIPVSSGSACNDSPKPFAFVISVDTHNCANPCGYGGTGVVKLLMTCAKTGIVYPYTITMPANRCYAQFYVVSSCFFNDCAIAACDLQIQSSCECSQ